MTTKVTIANSGFAKIKVEIKGRNAEGQFTDAGEKILDASTFGEFLVHDAQSIQIFEVKD